jgi:hypothetical protein
MKTLISCQACGREISPNATSCPHCGDPRTEAQPKPKQTATRLLIGSPLYFMIIEPAEQAVRYAKDHLEQTQDLYREAQKWSELAKRSGH